MRVPGNIPYLKAAAVLVGVFTVVWSALEGRLAADLLLASAALALTMAWLITRRLGGRVMSPGRGIALAVAVGAAYGVGLTLLALGLMALKTGLHAHGPEYPTAQIVWLWRQGPLWGAVGGLAGLGVGLLVSGRR